MRKLLLSAVAMLATAGAASAADYTVYKDGTVGQDLNVNVWYNAVINAAATNPSGDGKVFEMTYQDLAGANFCAGIQAPAGTSITGPLNTATLTFSYYATTACKVTVQVNATASNKQEYVLNVTADDINKWNNVSLPMSVFP